MIPAIAYSMGLFLLQSFQTAQNTQTQNRQDQKKRKSINVTQKYLLDVFQRQPVYIKLVVKAMLREVFSLPKPRRFLLFLNHLPID